MIFFIAPNPHTTKREGFLQRIYAIDQLFASEDKKYIDDCLDEAEVIRSLAEADVIYIHSMYQASRIKDFIEFFSGKIIVDLHGVVPEELEYMGDESAARAMNDVEAKVFSCVRHYIAVTNSMVRYYKKKYSKTNRKADWIVLPIFDTGGTNKARSRQSRKLNVIYTGGAQKWQSIDKMMAVIDQLKHSKLFTFTILSHDREAFGKIESYENVTIDSVPPEKVLRYYDKAALGFILRDDSIVNKVACPTKLIEYFEHDIVPIIDNAQIGDFEDLGYEYIHYRELDDVSVSRQQLIAIAQNNHRVVEKLSKISAKGRNQLQNVVDKIKRDTASSKPTENISQLAAHLQSEVGGLLRLNEALRRDLEQRTAEVTVAQEELTAIKSSKKWRLLTKMPKPSGKRP